MDSERTALRRYRHLLTAYDGADRHDFVDDSSGGKCRVWGRNDIDNRNLHEHEPFWAVDRRHDTNRRYLRYY